MPENPPTRPIVGHPSAWGRASFGARIQPYQLTPGATETMRVRVREKIDIRGVGTDVVEMEGIFTVRRDHACAVGEGTAEWGKSCIKTEFRALELAGESPVFGTVRVHLDPSHASHGEVGPADMGSLAAKCVAHCHPVIELPALGLRLTTGAEPIRLASKVIQVPPVGDVARSENSAALLDDQGRSVGEIVSSDIEVGEVLWSTPLGGTRTQDEPEHVHTGSVHVEPSGSQFYAQASIPPVAHAHGAPITKTTAHAHGAAPGDQVEAALLRVETELRQLLDLIRNVVR